MANDAIGRYCRAVGRQLELPGAQKKKLLAGLRQELEDGCAARRPDWRTLCAEMGNPAETAETLMEGVSPERRAAYRSRRRRRTAAAIAVLLLLLLLLGGLFSRLATKQIVRAKERIIVEETVYE